MNSRLEDEEVEHWIREFQAGKDREENFGRLFRAFYRQTVNHLARSGVRAEDLDDMAQKVFGKIYRNLDGFRFQSKFSTWLFRIRVTTSQNYRRAKKTLKRSMTSTSLEDLQERYDGAAADRFEPVAEDASPLQQLLEEESIRTLHDVFESLPPQMQRCVKLRVRHKPYREIAEEMGISVSSVKTHLHHARRRLPHLLEPYFGKIEL